MTATCRKASYVLMTYNQQETVAASVQSALDQEGPALDIVISDDASRDDTFRIIETTVANYTGPHHVTLNRNPENLGLVGNFDKVHALSTGDVIINAAGDDISHAHRSSRIISAFSKDNPPMLVCSHATTINADGSPVPDTFSTALFHTSPDLLQVARSKRLYLGATGAWDRRVYDDFGPIEEGAYEDLVLGFRAMLMGRVDVIPEELVTYRLGGLSTSEELVTSVEALRANRESSLQMVASVMRQRRKDARSFGLDQTSPVWRILDQAEHKAHAGLAYWAGDQNTIAKLAARHPMLTLTAIYAERRKISKCRKRISA